MEHVPAAWQPPHGLPRLDGAQTHGAVDGLPLRVREGRQRRDGGRIEARPFRGLVVVIIIIIGCGGGETDAKGGSVGCSGGSDGGGGLAMVAAVGAAEDVADVEVEEEEEGEDEGEGEDGGGEDADVEAVGRRPLRLVGGQPLVGIGRRLQVDIIGVGHGVCSCLNV